MRITHCVECAKKLTNGPVGGLKKYCAQHALAARAASNKRWAKRNRDLIRHRLAVWYEFARKDNAAWRAENRRRAKAWRKKNMEHIRAYARSYYHANKSA